MPSYLHKEVFRGLYSTTTASTTTVSTTTTTEESSLDVETSTETMANETWQFDPREDISAEKAIMEETLKKVNFLVESENSRREREEVSEDPDPLFGQVEEQAKGLIEAMTSRLQEASAGEIVTLVVGIIVILYWIDRSFRTCFRYTVRRNYFMKETANGYDDMSRRAWKYLEIGLEKAWMPLWCSGEKIRQDTLVECVDEEFERARKRMEAMKPPNNTLIEPADVGQQPATTAQAQTPPSRYNDENEVNRNRR